MLPQIALHIGAHKTATTHLQRSLSEQRTKVEAANARFFGPPFFRTGPGIAELFGLEGAVTAADARAHLTKMAGPAARVVMSEENFIGTMHNRHAKIEMPLYPKASQRLCELADRLAPEGIDVFLGVRNPAAYITSGYCQALIGGHKVVLDEVKAMNPITGVDWSDLVRRLRDTAGVRHLTVWQYEDYHALFGQIVTGLIGAPNTVEPLQSVVHPGLSTEAVARILMRYADGKGRKAAVRARDKFPVGPEYASFDAFDDIENAAAAEQYRKQISQIAAMDGVTLLKA